MTVDVAQVQAAVRGMLEVVAEDLRRSVPAEWDRALSATPRHRFLPDTIWLADDDPYRPVSRSDDQAGWFSAAYTDAPVITQINDGAAPSDPNDLWASSSASQPSIVVRMLMELDVRPGQRVMEIGTGTGWNTALLAERVGAQNVVSVELDAALAARARDSLLAAGVEAVVVVGDGADGWEDGGPYDRVIATCSVRQVPVAWISQSRPGSIVLTPWESPWCSYGLLRLRVAADGSAAGRFSPHSAFMLMRGQRIDLRIYRDIVHDEDVPDESLTSLDPGMVAGEDFDVQFALGLRLGDVWHVWDHDPDVAGVTRRLWLATVDGSSWAAVDQGEDPDLFTAWQHGSRRLWDEVEAGWAWFEANDRPSPSRFGLTVDADGTHRAWLDGPGQSWRV